MQNILTIYKFNFPFLDEEFEKAKYNSICDDIKDELMYLELYLSKEINNNKNYETHNIKFKWGNINIVYKKNNNWYFIPKFELNLYIDKANNTRVINDIIDSIVWLWLDDYIFDLFCEKNIQNIDSLVKNSNIKNYFDEYTENKLEKFLKNIDKNFLEDQLNNNKEIKYSFYYLMYLSYVFYKNYINSEKEIKVLEEIINKEDRIEFKNNLILSEIKLEDLHDLNLVTFKKYKLMLDNLFELLK